MTIPRLPQYDGAGDSGFAALVGGLLNGAQAGLGLRRQRWQDQRAEEDRARQERRQDIEDQMRRDEAGYEVTNGPGPLVQSQPEPTHPGHAPMDEDPRDMGGGTSMAGGNGVIGYDQSQAAPVGNPFEIPQGSVAQRVGAIVQGGPAMVRRTHESAQERLARIASDRQFQLEGMRTSNARAEDQARLARETAIHQADNDRADRVAAGNNRTQIRVAEINAGARRDVADMRGGAGGSSGMKDLITQMHDQSSDMQRAIDGAQKSLLPVPKFGTQKQLADIEAKNAPTQRRIDALIQQRDELERKRTEVSNRMMAGVTDVSDLFPGGSPPPATRAGAQPAPSGQAAGPNFAIDAERQKAEAAIRRVMANTQLADPEKQRRIQAIQQAYQQRSGAGGRSR